MGLNFKFGVMISHRSYGTIKKLNQCSEYATGCCSRFSFSIERTNK